MRKWTSGRENMDYAAKVGAGIGYAAARTVGSNVHVPKDHWTYKNQRKGKIGANQELATAVDHDSEEEYAELDLEVDQLEAYDEYRAEAEDLEELFR